MVAAKRAETTLRKTIGDYQWRLLQKTGFIELKVTGIHGVSSIRIDGLGRTWAFGNFGVEYMCVDVVEEEDMPRSDVVLTLYVLAKYYPRKLLRTANWKFKRTYA